MSAIETPNLDAEAREVIARANEEQLARILGDVLDKRDAAARKTSPLYGVNLNLIQHTDAGAIRAERKKANNLFLRCVMLGPGHPKCRDINFDALARDLSEGTGSEGGYLTKTAFYDDLIVDEENISDFEMSCKNVPLTDKTSDWPTVTGKPTAAWRSENAVISNSEPTFGNVTMTPHSLDVYAAASLEVVADSRTDLEVIVGELLSESMLLAKQEAFTTGNGSGKPRGILYSDSFTSIAQADTDLQYRDISNFVFSLPQQYRKRDRAVFIANNDFYRICAGLISTTGVPIFTEAMSGDGTPRLFGYRAIELPDIEGDGSVSSPTSALFGVLNKTYQVGTRKELEIMQNTQGDTPWKKNQVWIKACMRLDGKTVFTGAMRKLTDISFTG